MTNERKAQLFDKAIEWIWEHTEDEGITEYLNALKRIGYTKQEVAEEIAMNNFDNDHKEEI